VPAILGCLLVDALDGFRVPFYPRRLQKARENAALVNFDFDILQYEIPGLAAAHGAWLAMSRSHELTGFGWLLACHSLHRA